MLTEIERLTFDTKPSACYYLYKCDCGNTHKARRSNVASGSVDCCKGCAGRRANSKQRATKAARPDHDNEKHPLYSTWKNMRSRCFNVNDKDYSRYGERGITVHPRWKLDFRLFVAQVGPKPSEAHSLDRINNDGNYEPGNVRWATREEQAKNTRYSK